MTRSALPETTFTLDLPAQDAVWSVVHFTAREAVSALYEAALVVAADDAQADVASLLGLGATLTVTRGGESRAFHGVVRAAEALGATPLRALARVEVAPRLWLLSQRSDCRIFQQMNVAAIVRAVLAAAGVYQGEGELTVDPALEAAAPREYCVQYNETDLAFVRRLLEEEGAPFYFRHDRSGGEALVVAGDAHVYPEAARAPLRVLDEGLETWALEAVRWFDERHALGPTGATVRDYDFTRPRVSLSPSHPTRPGERERYEFPARATLGQYSEEGRAYRADNTSRLARVRHEEHLTRAHVGHGSGNVTGFTAGARFELREHARADLDRAYLLVGVEHCGHGWKDLPEDVTVSERLMERLGAAGALLPPAAGRRGAARYANHFTTHRLDDQPASVPFRPRRETPRPIVEGPQTAVVVGPEGEEIHTDPHGRIKVQFPWDRQGAMDDRSSCWIRVAQSSSGGGWGFTVLPRVGMEVVVAFLEGDPDRPLVTACVNNGENGTSYPLPESKTKSVIKTWSSPRSGGYNEIRFEDASGSEQLYVQAERDHDTLVKNDQTLTVRRDRAKVVAGDETSRVEQNRAEHVVVNDTLRVDGDRAVAVHGAAGYAMTIDASDQRRVGRDQALSVAGNCQKQVGADESTRVGRGRSAQVGKSDTLTVGKHLTTAVGKNLTTTVGKARSTTVAASDSLHVGAAQTMTCAVGSWSAGAKLSLDAGALLTLTVGESSLTLTPESIVLKAKRVELYGAAKSVIEGEVVKINCGEKPEAPAAPKKAKESLLDRIKKSWKDFLAKLPKPLAAALEKAAASAIQQVKDALAQGKLPRLGDVLRGALKAGVEAAVGQAFEAVKGLDAVKAAGAILPVDAWLKRAQERVTSALLRGVDAMGATQAKLADAPAWQRIVSEQPAAARGTLLAVGRPVADNYLEKSTDGVPEVARVAVAAAARRAADAAMRDAATRLAATGGAR